MLAETNHLFQNTGNLQLNISYKTALPSKKMATFLKVAILFSSLWNLLDIPGQRVTPQTAGAAPPRKILLTRKFKSKISRTDLSLLTSPSPKQAVLAPPRNILLTAKFRSRTLASLPSPFKSPLVPTQQPQYLAKLRPRSASCWILAGPARSSRTEAYTV